MERIPPYSEEAERSVLGSILLNSSRVMDLCVEKGLQPESFFVSGHRAVFETLMEMWREGKPIDVMTVTDKLKVQEKLDGMGGAPFVCNLIDSTPTASHAHYYADLVGEKHLLRRTIECAQEIEQDCYGDEQAHAVVSRAEQSVFNLCDENVNARPWGDTIRDNVDRIDKVVSGEGNFAGIPSGYHNIDEILLGFKKSEMIIIAARPSMGKTALALNIAERIALGHTSDSTPKPVAVFSLEMSSDSLAVRMLCSQAKVPSHGLTRGIVSGGQHRRIVQAAQVLCRAPIYIDDTGGLTVDQLRARSRRLRQRHGVAIIFIDYLQLVRIQGFEHRSRNEEVSAVSASLKAMAKELTIPVVVLSQLSRASEHDGQRKPRLSDLRDSGAIEQDADVVCLLRRPCKLAKDEEHDDESLAIVEVAKNRNGPTGDMRFNFEDRYTRFEDRIHGVNGRQPGLEPQEEG